MLLLVDDASARGASPHASCGRLQVLIGWRCVDHAVPSFGMDSRTPVSRLPHCMALLKDVAGGDEHDINAVAACECKGEKAQ